MAFGKRNEVKIDPLSYTVCLLGESKVGKTTLIKEVLEKLDGTDGSYLFAEVGSERGAEAISGINYINCPNWDMDEYDEFTNSIGFGYLIEDIIDNKATEYPNLRVLVIDTYDHLINIAEEEAIRLWNKECRQNNDTKKIAKTLNQSWGGFSAPSKKVIDLMLGEAKARLKEVGVEMWVIGHVKTKDIDDPISGQSYQILTSDQQQNYFNALKKELHFLGLAYIDREIAREKTGKKNIVTNKEEVVGKIKSETRRIKFRDDSFAVDSGTRFAEIVDEIPMDADAFIEAITDAIKAEASKGGASVADAEKKQKKAAEEQAKKVAAKEEENRSQKELESVVSDLVSFFSENKSDMDKIKPILMAMKELGYGKPTEINSVDDAKKILAMALAA